MNPFQEAPKHKKRMTLIGIYVAMIGSIMVSTSNSTLLPAAAMDIGGKDIYALASSIAGILSISAMPLFGYLSAKNPALKRPLFAISLFTGAAVIFCRAIAPNMIAMIIPSFFWGLVSAGLYVIGFSMIRDMYDMKQAGIYLGAIGTMMSIGTLLGPIAAGALIDLFNWRVACHVIWPILAVAGLLVFFGPKATKEECKDMAANMGVFDFAGAVALVVFLTSMILVLSLGTSFMPFGSTVSNVLIVLGVISLAALIAVITKKKEKAFVPAPVLKDRNVLCLAACNLTLNFSSMAVFFFMPAYVMYVIGGTAIQAGLTTTLMSIPGLFISPFLGKMIAKAGNARTVLTAGTVIRILITLCFLLFLSPTTSLWFIYALMVLAGIYNSQQSVTFSTAPQIQIKPELRMMGNSMIQVCQGLGSSIAMSVYTLVIAMYGVVDGMPVALGLATGGAVIALIFGFMLKKLNAPEEQPAQAGRE